MGNGGLTCCCKNHQKNTIVLLLLGLDNAGKTVAVKGLAGESLDSVVPTVGFALTQLNYGSYLIKIYDLGGSVNIRGIWTTYFVDAHGVIFVIDSTDVFRLEEVKEILNTILSNKKISGKPILLLANKQDNENALDEIDLVEKLDLERLVNTNECPTLVESCSAKTTKIDPGIKRGYEWLLNYIIRNYKTLNERVQYDLVQAKINDSILLQERIQSLKNNSDEPQKNGSTIINGVTQQRIVLNDRANVIRPKSAVELVRRQLSLNGSKKPLTRPQSRKTAPIHLYGATPACHSARVVRKKYKDDGRNVHSAGSSLQTHSTVLPDIDC